MISYLTNDCIDRKRWDDCVAHALNGNVYVWSWYLDIAHPGWEALVEINDDKYLSIMPVTRKKKYFINYLCQPFFVQQLGVFSREPITQETILSFLNAIPKRYRLVEIRLNEQNPLPEGCKGVYLHRNYLLDLSKDYHLLSSEYHENTKRNLKKSFNNGLELVKGVDVQQIIQLFRENRGAAVRHWGDAEYARLKCLTDRVITSSNAFVYGVKSTDSKEIICGALFMCSHQRITFLFSGNNAKGKETQAMTYLIDQVIREFAGQPLTLDFEGSDDENLARFYHGFGADSVMYPSFSYRFRNPLR
ncbi:MAG: hypothetical protein J6P73_03595 [Bacteroidales bacterium]|nr:hypothetical protein [Bacteroidales bacterium]